MLCLPSLALNQSNIISIINSIKSLSVLCQLAKIKSNQSQVIYTQQEWKSKINKKNKR